ncbi:4-hydroxythreonine-4-phosphate dehydrogenase [Tamaricihabitans halophyticus]|uniref:4-hydroxythreonine-4-phosphate dehydrogenase n=1 Tax=Tamaricihabitans halophyticus TaxID=1262583 RepID=A0A4V2SSM7_9PSEU|nr:four-carbon acid sugar kinase family protein [Tamaricihabitans halophyticus]TCP47356.1 4-hydroxythreonine-4-phosphate dehydrogenase [Tamaricihabitans halophyticus]
MRTQCPTGIFALADDLSGAAETAAALLPAADSSDSARIDLDWRSGYDTAHSAHSVRVVDLNSRHLSSTEAANRTSRVLAAEAGRYAAVFLKIDSLLRGNIAAIVDAARDRPTILAPTLPVAGRTVRTGVPLVHGVPLHQTDSWRAEASAPPATITGVLDELPVTGVQLETIRSAGLTGVLAELTGSGRIAVCDGVTDTDLDLIARAARELSEVRLIGSGGLAAALGRALRRSSRAGEHLASPNHQLLIVVGTADPGAAKQVRALVATGVQPIACAATTLITGESRTHDADRIRAALLAGPTVLTIDAPGPIDPSTANALVRGLATTVATAVRSASQPVDLVLTGGETARQVLDSLTIRSLTPITQVHHGAVHSRAPDGTSVITRPGSFGDANSLVQIVAHLRPTPKQTEG